MSARREFTKAVAGQIRIRATINGVITCEDCGLPCTRFHIDHIIPDALVVDKSKKLTAEEGQLLCAGTPLCCHELKTMGADVPAITQAKRQEASHHGDAKHAAPKGRGFPPPPKGKPAPRAPVVGQTNLARRFAPL